MKVYVTTKAKPFNPEQYIGVHPSKKTAEKALRAMFPYMKKSIGDNDAYSSDRDNTWILFIHEEEV